MAHIIIKLFLFAARPKQLCPSTYHKCGKGRPKHQYFLSAKDLSRVKSVTYSDGNL